MQAHDLKDALAVISFHRDGFQSSWQRLWQCVQCWLPARSLVQQAIEGRSQVDSSGEIVELSRGGVPWKEHLYALEASLKLHPLIKFCVFEVRRSAKLILYANADPASDHLPSNHFSSQDLWAVVRHNASCTETKQSLSDSRHVLFRYEIYHGLFFQHNESSHCF